MIGVGAVLELASTATLSVTIALVNRASFDTACEVLRDLIDHALPALARRGLEGESRVREVEMAVGPENPPVDERRRITSGSRVDKVQGDVRDKLLVSKMSSELSTEPAGVNVSVEQVVSRRSAESLVIEAQLEVSDIEVVEVAILAALCQRSELGGDQFDRSESQQVGSACPPVGVRREMASIERSLPNGAITGSD